MRTLIRAAALSALLIAPALAQSGAVRTPEEPSGKPAPRAVIVRVEGAEPVKGKLIKADSESVVLDVGAGETTIRIEKVISIEFQTAGKSAGGEAAAPSDRQAAAVEKIMSALRQLDNAVEVGVMFQNYSAMLIENKTVVDENLKDVLDPQFRYAVEQMLGDHQYAMQVWNLAVANNWVEFFPKQEPGRTLVTKYGVPVKISIWTEIPVMTGLRYVWLSARNHFNEATAAGKKIASAEPK
jgi:hypothetical protein